MFEFAMLFLLCCFLVVSQAVLVDLIGTCRIKQREKGKKKMNSGVEL